MIFEFAYSGGSTLYGLLADATGAMWNGSAFVTYADLNYATYDITVTQKGTTDIYQITIPDQVTAKSITIMIQAGGSPAVTDSVHLGPYLLTVHLSSAGVYSLVLPTALDDTTYLQDTMRGSDVTVTKIGVDEVMYREEVGQQFEDVIQRAVVTTLPTNMTDDGTLLTFSSGADSIYQSTRTMDMSNAFSVDLAPFLSGSISTNLAFYVGFGLVAADVNDITSDLILPTDSAVTKDQYLQGWIFYWTGTTLQPTRTITKTFGVYYSNDNSIGTIDPLLLPLRVRWDPIALTMSLYTVASDGAETLIQAVEGDVIAGIKDLTTLKMGVSTTGTLAGNNNIARGLEGRGIGWIGSDRVAAAGATVTNLDQIRGATTQTRINQPAGKAFSLSLSARNDGTHKATKPIRLRSGSVGSIAVSVDMMPVFGADRVATVGTPTVSPTGTLTVAALEPRDTEAMVTLTGTASASATYTVTVPVTMDSGEVVSVDFDVEVFAD